jgi:integrase
MTALDTGMRLSELLNLRREEVDLGQRVLTVRNTKSGRDRRIPLTQRVLSVVRERMRDPEPSGYLFPQGKGKRPWHARLRFARACERASLAGVRFHDLRHSFATRLVTRGVDLATVQRLLGHQDVRMTVRYAHPRSEDIKKAIRTLEEMAGYSHKMDTTSKRGLRATSITP